MNSRSFRLTLMALAACLAAPAFAYWTPLQISLSGSTVALPPTAEDVWGIRANVYGCNKNVAFIDAGVFNRVTEGVYGIRAGGVNWSEGDAYGLTAGAFNFDNHNAGLVVGAFNVDKTNEGLVVGAFNYAETGAGFQIGVINIADRFTGVQIGVLNLHFKSAVPFFPLFNMGSGSGN